MGAAAAGAGQDGFEAEVLRVRAQVAGARSVCVLSGAGMSAESGIATFRDALTGLWSRFDPMALASRAGFRADPGLVWGWYAERREAVRRAQPNAGHLALGGFARRHPGRLTVVTQNVDDLHQRAGNTDALRLHGDILVDQWLDTCPFGQPCATAAATAGRAPQCARCGNHVRPGVVWFGEALPEATLRAAEQASEACELMLVVGTSGAVWPAAGLAVRAREAGAQVIIVNPNEGELDDVAHTVLRGTAAGVLPRLFDGI